MVTPRNGTAARVAIVDDHQLFAESLEIALRHERYEAQRVRLPNESVSTTAVAAAIARCRPQVVLLDLNLGRHGSGLRLIEPTVQTGARVVVLTGTSDRATWGECLARGATTVLLKAAPLEDVLGTVRRIVRGQPVLSEEQRASLMWHRQQRLRDQHVIHERLHRLTPREREVLGHLIKGRTVTDIAAIGTVSEATVRTQVKSILGKLEVSSQIAAVGLAHRVGWTGPESREPGLH